ncbi:MAG: hypothetical protein PHV30_05200 [Candidatus Margulisbacteria bacterium]|nr:hypothetical protein [Candidatus Margulisiibacteriota bacterium]
MRFGLKLLTVIFFTAFSYGEIIGGYASDYLDYGVGARAAAMGKAARTIMSDATAGYWNSASLAKVKQSSITYMNISLLDDVSYIHAGMAFPLGKSQTIAINYIGLNVAGIEMHNGNQPSATADKIFSAGAGSIMMSYGWEINKSFSVGCTGKYGFRNIDQSNDSVLSCDLGFLMNINTIKVGGNIRNLLSIVGGDTSNQYELDLDLGISGKITDKLLLTIDSARLLRGTAYYAGLEYLFIESNSLNCSLRGGINSSEISAGFGLQVYCVSFDYACIINNIGTQHQVAFSYDLGAF